MQFLTPCSTLMIHGCRLCVCVCLCLCLCLYVLCLCLCPLSVPWSLLARELARFMSPRFL